MSETEAKRREARAKTVCTGCDGQGHFSDDVQCSLCYGTGLPEDQVRKIINDATAPYRALKADPELIERLNAVRGTL